MVWPDGFAAVYREAYVPMVRLAYVMLGSRSEAEEVVQDAVVRAGQHDADDIRAYLRQAVVNGAIGVLRRRSVAERHAPDPAKPEQPTYLVELRDTLLQLPERQRAAIGLRYIEGLTDDEIAGVLDCRLGTVRSLISRGLATLRKEVSS